MKAEIDIIKGIHPGAILDRELKRKSLQRGRFALSIGEYPQTLGAVINGKRRMNPALSLKIERALGFEEGYFMVLQAYYDVKIEKLKQLTTPNLDKLRPALFWDADIKSINWQQAKRSVILRVFERGNETERTEITRYYGKSEVDDVLNVGAGNEYRVDTKK